MMNRTHLLLAVALALALAGAGRAQTPLPDALPAVAAPALGGDTARLLQALPQPRDLPASLYVPPPPPTAGYVPVDVPYFLPDPLLDSPQLGYLGWFYGAEIQILKPHVIPGLNRSVETQIPNITPVALPSAPLSWTVAPRFFVGYRLPSGFGSFLVDYRFLDSSGSSGLPLRDGPSALRSRLAFNMINLDYYSRELSLWPQWDMRWLVGAQILTMFYDSQDRQPFAQAVAGNHILLARQSNNFAGGGPHVALELARHLGNSGWALYFRTDFSSDFGGSRVNFSTLSATLGPNGRPHFGETSLFGSNDTPILNVRAGLTWQPGPNSASRLFLGYQFERFWALNRNAFTGPNPPSTGQVWDQGIVLQASLNY
jgi:hypothetical protein